MDCPNISNRQAFSFTEIIIVVLVIGILAAAAVPKYQQSLSKNSLLSAARRVAADIRLARSTAMTVSANRTVAFVPEASTYELFGVDDASSRSAGYVVNLGEAPYRSILDAAVFDDGENLTFNGFGIPNAQGFVRLKSGDYRQVVSVSVTGVVKIHKRFKANEVQTEIQTDAQTNTQANAGSELSGGG